MIKLLFSCLLILGAAQATAQSNAYYQTLFILELLDSDKEIESILMEMQQISPDSKFKKYRFNAGEVKSLQALTDFSKTPFSAPVEDIKFGQVQSALNKYNKYAAQAFSQKGFAASAGMLLSAVPSLMGSMGNFSGKTQSDLIDGLARYFAEEFKKGITLSFVNTFEQQVDRIGELQSLMPDTYDLLKHRDPFTYPEFGREWKETFEKDLRSMVDNLILLIDDEDDMGYLLLSPSRRKIIRESSSYPYLKVTADASNKLINKYHPVDLINYLDFEYYMRNDEPGFYQGIHLINLVQTNLRDTSKTMDNQFSNVWIGFEDFMRLNRHVRGMEIFLAILYQQDEDFFSSLGLFDDLKQASNARQDPKKVKKVANDAVGSIVLIHKFLVQMNEFEVRKDDKLYDDEFVNYIQTFMDLITSVSEIEELHFTSDDRSRTVVDKTLDVYQSVHKREYLNIISNVAIILENLIGDKEIEQEEFLRLHAAFMKYGNFMEAVVNAEDSEEMKDVIKKYVAPPSSFVRKRTSAFSTSVSGYPGLFVGQQGVDNEAIKDYNTKVGLTAPVGVDLNWAINKKQKMDADNGMFSSRNVNKKNERLSYRSGSNVSLNLQVADLGTIFSYRLDGLIDSTGNKNRQPVPDTISFKQIFSPGAALSVGFKNTPFTIGLGYQYSPTLGKIDQTQLARNPKHHRPYVRFVWDIPLAHLYHTNRLWKKIRKNKEE